MRLFICEKLASIRYLSKAGVALDGDVAFLTASLGAWKPELPQVSFPSIPFTELLDLNSEESGFMNGMHIKMLSGGVWVDVVEHGDLKSRLRKAAADSVEIVVAVDNDRRGAYGAKQALDVIGCGKKYSVMTFSSFSENDLQNAWALRTDNLSAVDRLECLALEQTIKKHFDVLWHINSVKVLKETCLFSQGVKTAPISKMEMLTLKLVQGLDSSNGSFRQEDVLSLMKTSNVGSCTTQAQILTNMMKRGLFEAIEDGFPSRYRLSECAKRFIGRCHPESFDLELPSKLDKWMQEQDLTSAINYIDTYFKRQLEYQRKLVLG